MTTADLDQQLSKLDERRGDLERELNQVVRDIATTKAFREMIARITASDNAPLAIASSVNGKVAPEKKTITPDMHGFKAKAIRKAINECGEAFTVYNIEEALQRRGVEVKRISISQTLYDFADKGEISIGQKAAGRRPAVYHKTSTSRIEGGATKEAT